jgi:hypothetical protein
MKRVPSQDLSKPDATKKSKGLPSGQVRDLNKDIVSHFFKFEKGSTEKYKCVCGKVRSQKPGTGNSNLVQHVKEAHENWEQQLEAARKNSITRYFQADAKSYQIYGWLDLIISEGYAR